MQAPHELDRELRCEGDDRKTEDILTWNSSERYRSTWWSGLSEPNVSRNRPRWLSVGEHRCTGARPNQASPSGHNPDHELRRIHPER